MPAPIRYAQAVTLKPSAAPVTAYYSGYGGQAVQDFRPGMVATVANPDHILVTSNRPAVLVDFTGDDGTIRRASLYRSEVAPAKHDHGTIRAALANLAPADLWWHADRYSSAERFMGLIMLAHSQPELLTAAYLAERVHEIARAGTEDGADYGSIPCLAGPPFSVWARACFPLTRHGNAARLIADAARYEDEIPSITVTLA